MDNLLQEETLNEKIVGKETLEVTMGPQMTALLQRDDITEVYVNNDGCLWYESAIEPNSPIRSSVFMSEERRTAFINLVAGQVGKIVDENLPALSTEVAGFGFRFEGLVPPCTSSPQFNIRKKATRIFTLSDYVNAKTLSLKHKEYLEQAVLKRKNILIAGGTGTGKTTLLNALLGCISELTPTHRIISLEDLPELQCASKNYRALFVPQETGAENVKIDMTFLLKSCMRQAPDRIIVGEVRDFAAYTMLNAWNTGHPGGVCSTHADNGIDDALDRIHSLALSSKLAPSDFILKLIGKTIDVVVVIERIPMNGKKIRVINEIIEVDKYDFNKKEYVTKQISRN